VIRIGRERAFAPELLFNPMLIGSEDLSLPAAVHSAIQRTDLDLRRTLYSSILLSGGTTLLKGFGDRLLSELKKLNGADVRIKITAPPERKYSAWIGGSILASLATFKKMWISAAEWSECGPSVLDRHSFL